MQKEYLTGPLKYLTDIFPAGLGLRFSCWWWKAGLWLGPHDFWRSVFTVVGVAALGVLVGIGFRLDRAM